MSLRTKNQPVCAVQVTRSDEDLSMMRQQQEQEPPGQKFPWLRFAATVTIAVLVVLAIYFFVYLRVGG